MGYGLFKNIPGESIFHQKWAKTREPGVKPPDHLEAELGFPTCNLYEAPTTVVRKKVCL